MDKKIFIGEIKSNSNFLYLDNYQFLEIGDCIIQFQKNMKENGYELTFQYHESADDKGYFFRVNAVSASKRFNTIEKEIQKILGGNLINYYTIHIKPDINVIPKHLEHDNFLQNISYHIRDEKNVILFLEFVKTFYHQTAIPFFEKFNNINAVNEQLKNLLEAKKIQSLLTDSGGNSAILRYYAIGLMCNNQFVINFFNNIYYPYIFQQKDKLSIIEYNHLIKLKNNIQ